MAKKKKKSKRKAKRKCGICRKPGHNRSNCPTLVQHGKYESEPKVRVRERTASHKRRPEPQVHVRPMGTPAEELHRRATQRDPSLRSTPHATLPEIKRLVHFANTVLIAVSQADRYSVGDLQALCKSVTHHLPDLLGGHLYLTFLDLLRTLQGSGNRQAMERLLNDIVQLVELYGGELHVPQLGDEFDYDIHIAVANHPDVTPGQKVIRQVVECGLRFGDYHQPAAVIVTQSRPSHRSLRRKLRRYNPDNIRQEMIDLFSARRNPRSIRRRHRMSRNPESDAQIRQEMVDLFSARRNPWEAPKLCEACFQAPCVCPCDFCGEQPCQCCAVCGHAPRGEGFGAVMNLEGRACRCPCHSWNANKPRH